MLAASFKTCKNIYFWTIWQWHYLLPICVFCAKSIHTGHSLSKNISRANSLFCRKYCWTTLYPKRPKDNVEISWLVRNYTCPVWGCFCGAAGLQTVTRLPDEVNVGCTCKQCKLIVPACIWGIGMAVGGGGGRWRYVGVCAHAHLHVSTLNKRFVHVRYFNIYWNIV